MKRSATSKNSSSLAVLSLDAYQTNASKTDRNKEKGLKGLPFFLLGLFGEVGTLLSALKKKRRDQNAFLGYNEAIEEEFGDVLWYFSNVLSRADFKLSDVAYKSVNSPKYWTKDRHRRISTFAEAQSKIDKTGSADSKDFERALIALAGTVGMLLHDLDGARVTKNPDTLAGHLIDIWQCVIEAANVADVDLEVVAMANIHKITSRWPITKAFPSLFDDGYPLTEQFPRKISLHIEEKTINGRTVVTQRYKEFPLGSPITDNRLEEDGYRFHDVFHLAYAAILGWSPVLRALMRRKRKSTPKVDEAEDGARAILIEECISAMIFQKAARLNYFESLKSLDYTMLKVIPDMVRGYEVEKCPIWQWEKAILDGFDVFREIKKYRKGIVTANLSRRTIKFRPLL